MSREKILAAIRRNKPSGHPLPDDPVFDVPVDDLVRAFTLVSEGSGSTVVDGRGRPLADLVEARFPEAKVLYSTLEGLPNRGLGPEQPVEPHGLQPVDVAVMRGVLAVAENGAVWVSERELGQRVSAFIAQHLVLVVDPDTVVWNMHQAYAALSIDDTGYGVFIAGPSKTADIEQSLVIGAQGARSLTVVLTGPD